MRRWVAPTAVAALVGALGLAGSAEAGVTYDFAFRTTDFNELPIAGGFVSGDGHTFTFSSTAAAANCMPLHGLGTDCPILDVILKTTDPLFSFSVSLSFDNSRGLAMNMVQEWSGIRVQTSPLRFLAPLGGLACTATGGVTFCSSFDGVIIPPNVPPSLPPGTYIIGSVILDTSALGAGQNAVMTSVLSNVDATGAVIGGIASDITGTETVASGSINVIPEPATGAILALGLAGLAALHRRSRAPSRPMSPARRSLSWRYL